MPQAFNNTLKLSLLGLMLVLSVSSVCIALEQTMARDILTNPLRYQSSVAKIIGEVVKVEPDPVNPGAGTYTILDTSDTPIRVRTTRQFPNLGEQVYVVGLVYQEDIQAKPFIDELRRGRAVPPLKLLVGTAGVLAFIAFILVYLLIWHKPGPQKPQGKDHDQDQDAPVRKPAVTQVFQDDPVAILSAVSGPHKGQTFNIYQGVTTIGREDDQTIILTEDKTVSRSQARIVVENGSISLFNESATNPTRVDGKKVEKRDLQDGSFIAMGATKLKLTLFEE